MRVALVTNTYPPRLGGLEQHVGSLAQGLADLGHEVHVLTIADAVGRRTDGDVTVLTGRRYLPVQDVVAVPRLGTTREIARYLHRHQIEVVSTHTRFFPMSLIGLRAARDVGIPVIHTEHGSGFVASSSPIIAAGSRVVDQTVGRYVLSHANRVLGVSENAVAFARTLGARDAQVFYNAIAAPAPYPRTDRPHHLVFVGRMVPGKGWDTFLAAFAELVNQGFVITGELLGDGPDLDDARQQVSALGLSDRVAVMGRVPADEVRRRLSGATLVNPTVLSEGFQTTLLEAVAESGRVVTFEVAGARVLRTQGAPVVIAHARSVAALVDAIREVLTRAGSSLPPASPSVIEQWTWPVRARQYAAVMESVVAESQTSRSE